LAITIDEFMRCLNNKGLIHAIFWTSKRPLTRYHIRKLATYGIRGKPKSGLLTFYPIELKGYLVGGKSVTDSARVLSGVPRGTDLGPLLFKCYINLPNNIKSKFRIYADDTIVYIAV